MFETTNQYMYNSTYREQLWNIPYENSQASVDLRSQHLHLLQSWVFSNSICRGRLDREVESAITSWANLRNYAVYGCLLAWSIFDNPQDFPLAKQQKH